MHLLIAPRHQFFAVVITGFLSVTEAYGELVFEKQEVKATLSALAPEMVGRFPFRNAGLKEIKITSLESCCGCTKGSTTKQTYAPGEAGEILITFEIGNRHGLQRKGIVVSTNDSSQPPLPLFVTAEIPTVMTLSSQVLLWKEGEAVDSKKFSVTTLASLGVRELRVASESNVVRAAVERTGDSKFSVSVTPSSNARNLSDTLHIDALMENGQAKRSSVYARIR